MMSDAADDPHAARPVTPVDVLLACEVLLKAGYTAEAMSVLAHVLRDAGSLRAMMALWDEAERRHGG
jgi:hypothetical protein